MAVGTAIAVAGAAAQVEGSRRAGRAAQKGAQASAAESARQFNIQQDRADQALALASSPQEMQALQQSLEMQQTSIDKQASLFNALDPAVMAASENALQLLQGQEAKALAPLRKNRERQRDKLMNRLREQLGPGAETSTAGIQALNQFDAQTDEVLSGAQQQSLGQLFGMASSGAANRGALNQGIGQMANIGQGFGNIAARKSNAVLGGSSNLGTAGRSMVDTAGSQFLGQQFQGQNMAQLGGKFAEAGIQSMADSDFSFGDIFGGGTKLTQPQSPLAGTNAGGLNVNLMRSGG